MLKHIESEKRFNSLYFSPLVPRKTLLYHLPKSKQSSRLPPRPPIELNFTSINYFTYHHPLGKGGFGKVWKVESKQSHSVFALKEMQKAKILSKNSVQAVITERKILEFIKDPFIVNMHSAFQDREKLYLLLDLKNGGDLRHHMRKTRFTEDQARFFAACIVHGLNAVHSKGVIHRDIKPENLIFDEEGFLHITDFGISRLRTEENSTDTSGTVGYMAPEVMFHQNHGFLVDYFALGVILYEIIIGRRPYIGRDRKEVREHVLSKQAKISEFKGWSAESLDFVNRLIERKVSTRLGKTGFIEIQSHPWFKDFDWKKLGEKKLSPLFKPVFQSPSGNISDEWKDEIIQNIDLESSQVLFLGFNFNPKSNELNKVHQRTVSIFL